MATLLNVVLVALVLLIAYWWANQGLFSAILHFVCVVAAGAIALGVWEPLVVKFLLKGGSFDDYAWGIVLIGVFTVTLFALRFAVDKVVPDNLNVPTWANYLFGGMFGAGAGVLTIGMFMIGAGFLQTSTEIMGFLGVARDKSAAGQPVRLNTLYPPIHEWTQEFYSFLSDGAFSPTFSRASLGSMYPSIADEAVSLHRDSYKDGGGKSSVSPAGVKVQSVFKCDTCQVPGVTGRGVYSVLLDFDKIAFDFGEQLTLSCAQVRLIGAGRRWKQAPTAYPVAWYQIAGEGMQQFAFDDLSHYATSVPGQQSATIMLVFRMADLDGTEPEYIQVKGLRMSLPAPAIALGSVVDLRAAASGAAVGKPVELAASAPLVAGDFIRVDSTIPMTLSANQLSGMSYVEDPSAGNTLDSGRQEFPKGAASNVGKQLRIRGIYEPQGTRVVKLDVSRKSSPIDLYGDRSAAIKNVPDDAMPMLVDSNGRGYQPIGYIWDRPGEVEISLDPANGISALRDLPSLSSAGTDKLFLVFRITTGTQLRGFVVGDVTLGLCDVVVSEAGR